MLCECPLLTLRFWNALASKAQPLHEFVKEIVLQAFEYGATFGWEEADNAWLQGPSYVALPSEYEVALAQSIATTEMLPEIALELVPGAVVHFFHQSTPEWWYVR